MPQLDGLRCIAFLLILSLHLSQLHRSDLGPAARFVTDRGWIGVELFFCISALLFFRLMDAEWRARGRLDVARFFLRRLLRIYPLMMLYGMTMVLLFSNTAGGWRNLIPIALGLDNIAAWFRGFNPIRDTGHLWTLSAEFQLYAAIPLAFVLSRAIGERLFLVVLLVASLCALVARYALVRSDIHLPVVWVTPALHPEATLLGMAAGLPVAQRIQPRHVFAIGAAAGIAFLAIPTWYHRGNHLMWVYPVAAVLCASLVWLAAQSRLRVLSMPGLVYLGRISFGLYVFHVLAIHLAFDMLARLGVSATFLVQLAVALLLCVVLAAVSYRFLETPFLRTKARLALVEGRPP